MKRLLLTVLCVALSVGVAGAQHRSAKAIKQQKVATQREIKETNNKIKENTAETRRSLNQLNSITAEIGEQQRSIDNLTRQLNSINAELQNVNDSIAANENKLQDLRNEYGKAIRATHASSSSMDRLMFVFQSSSFRQAMRRVRYLREFSRWRKRQADEIAGMQQRLDASRNRINVLATNKSNNIKDQNLAKLTLEKKKEQQSQVVDQLKKEGSQLRTVLAEKQRKANALDQELNRLIERERKAAEERRRQQEEARKLNKKKQTPADKSKSGTKTENASDKAEPKAEPTPAPTREEMALNGSFESNRGRLPYPVTGNFKIVRRFGVQQHPELRYVKTENGGIDIETRSGAVARAIFPGKVSAVFRQDGFNTVVMVRHGSYLTIYVNLSEIYVRTGETVKANQNIGKIYSDSDDDGRTILHFEIRKEKAKLNPEAWMRR